MNSLEYVLFVYVKMMIKLGLIGGRYNASNIVKKVKIAHFHYSENSFVEYYYTLSSNNMETYVHACMAGKLLILCNLGLHHSICTTLLCKILFTKF